MHSKRLSCSSSIASAFLYYSLSLNCLHLSRTFYQNFCFFTFLLLFLLPSYCGSVQTKIGLLDNVDMNYWFQSIGRVNIVIA